MSDVLLIVHILGVSAWFGASAIQFFMAPRMRKAELAAAASWQRSTVAMGTGLYAPAAIIVMVTGFGLVGTSDGAYTVSDTFVIIGIVMVVVGAVIGIRLLGPNADKAAAAYEADDRAGGDAAAARTAMIGTVDTILLIVTITAMAMKWGV